jgi:putative transposon-encoded protein
MKDVIYLTVAKNGVQSMKKSYLGCKKGEIIVKLNLEVKEEAFTPPTIEQYVVVNDWDKGVDIEDVKFEDQWITEEEAEMVREKRILKMKEILESQGYSVEQIEEQLTD